MVDYDKARDCEHGRQISKCGDCEYQDLLGELSDVRDELATVTAQRDELLKCLNLACDDIYTICDAWGATPPEISLARFRNIIAKCEAQNDG